MIDGELSSSRNLQLLMDYRLLHNTAGIDLPRFGTVVQKETWEILKHKLTYAGLHQILKRS